MDPCEIIISREFLSNILRPCEKDEFFLNENARIHLRISRFCRILAELLMTCYFNSLLFDHLVLTIPLIPYENSLLEKLNELFYKLILYLNALINNSIRLTERSHR